MPYFAITIVKCITKRPALRRLHAYLITCITIFICTLSPFTQANRANYGTTPYPIWSELTYFERSTLNDLAKTYNNDPNALLALYIVASGARDLAYYEHAQYKIKKFVKNTQKLIIDDDNQELMGALLNKEMHKTFFVKESRGEAPKGYSTEQSRVMGIFENGVFNCISSSLLYAVLASHFELNVEGVMLPSHAFIQLNLRGGRKIDIETTSPNGFDQTHDEAFYEKLNSEWFSSRSLEPATYQDYLDRSVISPTLLGANNMLNQHTGHDRMDTIHSGRLAEISAYINPSSQLANEKRLYFYATEIQTLMAEQQWLTLIRLFNTTYQKVLSDSVQFPDAIHLQHNLKLYLSGAMIAYAKAGNVEQTLTVMGELLSRGLTDSESQNEIESRVTNAVKILLNKLADQQRFEEGLLVLSLIEGHLSNPSAWPDMLSWFYIRWSKQYWDDKDWKLVIETLAEYLDHPNPNLKQGHISKTMGDAYTNWVIDLIQIFDDMETAKEITEECINSSHSHVCSGAKKLLKKHSRKML